MATETAAPCLGNDASVLYALIDAVACAGRLDRHAAQTRWRSLQVRIENGSSCEAEGALLLALLVEIDEQGLITDTWMQKRWRSLARRLERDGQCRHSLLAGRAGLP